MNDKTNFSNRDLIRNVNIPYKLTKELAEFIGIMIGDGYINLKPPKRYDLTITGHLKEDFSYHIFIKKLIKKLFNIDARFVKNNRNNSNTIQISSKALITHLVKDLKLKNGKKKNLGIPNYILKGSNGIKYSFLRGLADTDFTLRFKKNWNKFHHYPIISGKFSSKRLVKNLGALLEQLGFSVYTRYDIKRLNKNSNRIYNEHLVDISGKGHLKKWLKTIGFNNKKHLIKHIIWKKYGFCPPNLSFEDKIKLAQNKINPFLFYKKKSI